MKILDPKAGALTNFEVLDLLRSRGAGTDPTRVIASISPSEFKVFDYLEKSPACNQTREIIQKFADECKKKKFHLAKAEILNIVNTRPSSMVEVYQIIEDCDMRMEEDTIDELVETINQILPSHKSSEQTAEDNNEPNEQTAEENNEPNEQTAEDNNEPNEESAEENNEEYAEENNEPNEEYAEENNEPSEENNGTTS